MREGGENRKRRWVENDIDPELLQKIKVVENEAVGFINKLNAVIKANAFVDWDIVICQGCRQVTINEETFSIPCNEEGDTKVFCGDCTDYCKTCKRRYAWDMEPCHDHDESKEVTDGDDSFIN